jgi:putative aldouronate transport system permease protein
MLNTKLGKDLLRNKILYIMILPVVVYYILFHYVPMYGAIMAFKQYIPSKGILGSEWVGFKHFEDFFSSIYFFRVIKNTVLLSYLNLLFGFPAPIILALLLNEVKNSFFRRITQTITYMPH